MGTEVNPETPEVKAVQKEIDQTVTAIEKQEAKVENAPTPAAEDKESSKLDSLIEKFDGLIARMEKIDQRLAEPTVPAPPAKAETPALPPVASETPAEASPEGTEPPRKRRLGAW